MTFATLFAQLFYTHMGVDYVIIGFDMEIQPLVTISWTFMRKRCLHRCR